MLCLYLIKEGENSPKNVFDLVTKIHELQKNNTIYRSIKELDT